VFDIDVLVCPHCGGARRLLAAITAPRSVERVLRAMGLSAEAPMLVPARPPPAAEAGWWGARSGRQAGPTGPWRGGLWVARPVRGGMTG
jgi:hypothetical protein